MKKTIAFASLLFVGSAFSADPSLSVYSITKKNTPESVASLAAGGAADYKGGHWAFFTFGDSDKVLGSLAAENTADAQTIKFNAVNYYVWFGGKKYLPFQLYIGQTQAKDASQSGSEAANESQLLDPESGVALKFPVLWTYQSEGDGFCAFLSQTNNIGHCSVGGDVTFSFKDLKKGSGEKDTIFGTTLRFGAAVLFPILDAQQKDTKGYVSAAARVILSRFNADDSTQLFAPVRDASGEVIKFKGSIASSELEIKWKFDDSLAIAARLVDPIDNRDYLKRQFKIALETQF